LPAKKNKVSNTKLFEDYILAKDSNNEKEIINTRNRLIMHNQPLVTHVINKYFSKNMISKSSMQDLIQEGCFGLAEAIERFKPDKGFKFSTYAAWWIRQAVGSAIKETETPIVIPPHIVNLQNKYAGIAQAAGTSFEEALEADFKKGAISEKMMRSAIAAVNTNKLVSMDATGSSRSSANSEKSPSMLQKLESTNKNLNTEHSGELDMDKLALIQNMKSALKKLGPKKRNVLLLRFGIIEEPNLLKTEATKTTKANNSNDNIIVSTKTTATTKD